MVAVGEFNGLVVAINLYNSLTLNFGACTLDSGVELSTCHSEIDRWHVL